MLAEVLLLPFKFSFNPQRVRVRVLWDQWNPGGLVQPSLSRSVSLRLAPASFLRDGSSPLRGPTPSTLNSWVNFSCSSPSWSTSAVTRFRQPEKHQPDLTDSNHNSDAAGWTVTHSSCDSFPLLAAPVCFVQYEQDGWEVCFLGEMWPISTALIFTCSLQLVTWKQEVFLFDLYPLWLPERIEFMLLLLGLIHAKSSFVSYSNCNSSLQKVCKSVKLFWHFVTTYNFSVVGLTRTVGC